MFLFVLGIHGSFVERCESLVVQFAERAVGPLKVIAADSLEQIAVDAMRTGITDAVITSRIPTPRLRHALVDNSRSFVVAFQEPVKAVAELVLRNGLGHPEAVAAVASSYGALIGFVTAPGALILSDQCDELPQINEATAIAQHSGLPLSDAEIQSIFGTLTDPGPGMPEHEILAWWEGLSPAAREMTEGALGCYSAFPPSSGAAPILWTSELFFLGDRPAERVYGPIDITGRSRLLLHGPYIVLPAGSWHMSLALICSHEAAEREFVVELFSDRLLASATLRPEQEGRVEANLEFSLDELASHSVSIRVTMLKAAFDGALAIGGATFVRADGHAG